MSREHGVAREGVEHAAARDLAGADDPHTLVVAMWSVGQGCLEGEHAMEMEGWAVLTW